jgi:hypothetical protein
VRLELLLLGLAKVSRNQLRRYPFCDIIIFISRRLKKKQQSDENTHNRSRRR